MAKTHISSCGVMRKVVETAMATGDWTLEHGTKHNRLVYKTGRAISFGRSGSCPRAAKNVARDIRHVEAGMPPPSMCKHITTSITLGRRA